MAEPKLATMSAIMRLRTAQCEAARAGVLAADAALARMREAEFRSVTERDNAESGWRELLGARSPDPARLRLAGDWLVERERGLQARRLDTGIAQNDLEGATDNHGRSRARLDASREIGLRLQREAVRKREALDLAEAADAFLRRRRP